MLLVGGTDEGGDARRDAELIEVNADGSVASAPPTEGSPDGHRIGGHGLVLAAGPVLPRRRVDTAGAAAKTTPDYMRDGVNNKGEKGPGYETARAEIGA